jgi:hypothetical protein
MQIFVYKKAGSSGRIVRIIGILCRFFGILKTCGLGSRPGWRSAILGGNGRFII